jgi:hypothetical protein
VLEVPWWDELLQDVEGHGGGTVVEDFSAGFGGQAQGEDVGRGEEREDTDVDVVGESEEELA